MEKKYYDGTKLLSMKDLNGESPEIFICTTNRSGGKTTYFGRLLCNHWFKDKEKFCLIYRFNYELDDCANKFFKDIGGLFFQGHTMTSKRQANGIYHELFMDTEPCGYAIALNNADQIKKNSHMFSDVKRILFDEFQSETNHYCADEVSKLISVHTSIARGQGKFVRYVPVYMVSNPVSVINPYYVELGISERLNKDTKFLRGNGFVMENGFVEGASIAQKQSAFNRAFSQNKYIAYSAENVYLNDSTAFIEQPKGKSRYVCTIKYNGSEYGIRAYPEEGIVYCDTRSDKSFPMKLAVTTADHNVNYVMLKQNDMVVQTLRYYFERGCFRFKDLRCKEAVLKAVRY